jgi:cysteine desulfurase
VGAGALIVRDGLTLEPLIAGGGQELRRRAGTENVAAIAGFGAAARAAGDAAVCKAGLRDQLEEEVATLAPTAHIFAAEAARVPNTTCFALPGIGADLLLMGLDLEGVAVSSGAACSSGKVERSHVLSAMGVAEILASGAIRVSFGWNSTADDVSSFIAALGSVLDRAGFRAAA